MHRGIHELHTLYQNGEGSLLRFVSLFISFFPGIASGKCVFDIFFLAFSDPVVDTEERRREYL